MSDSEAKKHKASDRKLDKQREQGSVANVSEIVTYMGAITSLTILMALAPAVYNRLASTFTAVTNGFALPFNDVFSVAAYEVGEQLLFAILPIVAGTTAAAVLTSLIYNKGVPFALKPITPDFKRASPAAGLKRMFGLRTWVEVGLGFVRLTIWFSAAGLMVWFLLPDLFRLDYCGQGCAAEIALYLLLSLVFIAILLLVVAVVIEMLVQKFLFLQEQRMTDTEV